MEKTQHYEAWKKVDQHYDWCAFLLREYPCKKKKASCFVQIQVSI